MTGKFFNLLAVSTLAILACSFGPTQVNALSGESHNFVRHVGRGHEHFVKKRKRADGKRCRVRPPADTSPAAAAGSTPASSGTPDNNAQVQTDGNNNNPGNNNNNPVNNNNNPGNNDNPGSNNNPGNNNANTNTPAATQQPAGGISSGNVKGGVAWPNGPDPALANFAGGKVKHLYTWSPAIPTLARDLGFNVIPMLWGFNQVDEFSSTVKGGYATHVLGMNEPNQKGQSDMNAEDGCNLWKQHIAPLKDQGYKLISPATTSAPDGKIWMQDFFAKGCDADAVALHWYDVSADAFIDYLKDFHDTFKKPIWVTEFACQNFNGGAQCGPGEVTDFFNKVTAFMESNDWVEAYFPFGAMHDMQGVNTLNQLLAPDGSLTGLGNTFVHG